MREAAVLLALRHPFYCNLPPNLCDRDFIGSYWNLQPCRFSNKNGGQDVLIKIPQKLEIFEAKNDRINDRIASISQPLA